MLHGRENTIVISRAGKYQMAARMHLPEYRKNGLQMYRTSQYFYAPFCQFIRQNFSSISSTAINGAVSNHHCLILWFIGAPFLIFVQKITKIAADDWTMQRANI